MNDLIGDLYVDTEARATHSESLGPVAIALNAREMLKETEMDLRVALTRLTRIVATAALV